MSRTRDHAEGERIAIDIRTGQGNGLGCVFIGCYRLWVCYRRIVDRSDRDRDRRGVGVNRSVVRLEGEAVRPVVVRRRGVGQIGRCPAQGAVARVRYDAEGERIAIDIRSGQGNSLRRIFIGRYRLRIRYRRIIDRGDRDRDCRGVRVHRSVIRLEGEAVRSVVICRRRVGQVRRCPAQDAVARVCYDTEGERIAIDIRSRSG